MKNNKSIIDGLLETKVWIKEMVHPDEDEFGVAIYEPHIAYMIACINDAIDVLEEIKE